MARFKPIPGDVVVSALVTSAALYADIRSTSDSTEPGSLVRLARPSLTLTARADTAPYVEEGSPVVAGRFVWIVEQTLRGPLARQLVALDPETLRPAHSVTLPATLAPGLGSVLVASSSNLLWASADDELLRFDPETATLLATIRAAAPIGSLVVDTRALATLDQAGPTGVEACLRDPLAGRTIGCTSPLWLGATATAVGDGSAWFAYRTGMKGSAARLVSPATLLRNSVGPWDMGVSLSLVNGTLWYLHRDSQHGVALVCADPFSGATRDSTTISDAGGTVLGDSTATYLVVGTGDLVLLSPPKSCRSS